MSRDLPTVAKHAGERTIHPRVRRVLEYLRTRDLERQNTSLACLAHVAGLSPSRLMHVFTQSVGVPLRPYVLSLRVERAVEALAAGCTVTEAAHLAGFADGPHLSRTCRRKLGVSPRELLRRPHGLRRSIDISPAAISGHPRFGSPSASSTTSGQSAE